MVTGMPYVIIAIAAAFFVYARAMVTRVCCANRERNFTLWSIPVTPGRWQRTDRRGRRHRDDDHGARAEVPAEPTLAAVLAVLPLLAAYLLAFIYVAIYWNNHHHMMQSARKVTGAVLWANQRCCSASPCSR